MIVDKEQLRPYLKRKADLIPLHVWNKQTIDKKGKVIVRGKTPLNNNWTKSPKNIKQALAKAEQGFNIGYRLNDTDLIIDIDHRNFAEDKDSLEELCKFLDIKDLANKCPTVITGSGGFHYYLTKPADVLIRETIEQFPGIEFKTVGRQVVTAGSKHPNGTYYNWDDFCPPFGKQPKAPKKLLELLAYKAPKNQALSGDLNGDQLRRLLVQLDVDEFADNDNWFRIMCASHHGTAGAGIEEFLEWSLADMEYEDDEHVIRCRWASLSEKAVTITVNSLYKEVLAHGGDTGVITAEEEFEDFKNEEDDEHEEEESEFDDIVSAPTPDESYKRGIATKFANDLHPSSGEEEIIKAIRAALQAGTIEQVQVFKIIQAQLGWTKGQLNEVIKQIKERIIDDLGRILAEKTLNLKFSRSKGLVFNGQFWAYNGKYWIVVTEAFIGKMITEVLDAMRKKIDINVKENAIVNEAVSIIKRLAATSTDVLRLRERPYPVVNCLNGELWIKKDGTSMLKPHKAKSYLLQLIKVDYSPGSECPLFDKSIRQIFAAYDDCEDIVRHFEEYMGYVIHPDKRPAKWWLFKGPGGDGKTTLMKILSGILGDAMLPASIDSFKNSGDNHATETLPGKLLIYDDDLNRNTILPDGTLKQLSEDGELRCNPKGTTAFKFTKVCTVTMLSNGFPKTRDLTRGFRRRAMVMPFNRAFHEEGAILDLAEQIIKKEIAGVLNRALQGLQRLRTRGDFREPDSCRMAKELWISESNTVALFISERLNITKDIKDIVPLNDVYSNYNDWCVNYGINRVETKQQFRNVLEDMEIWYGKLAHNKRGFRGVTVIEEITDDFDDFLDGDLIGEDEDWDEDTEPLDADDNW